MISRYTSAACVKLKNSEVLMDLDAMLSHLSTDQKSQITDVITEYGVIFSDVPGRTDLVCHDVDVGEHKPIKQLPYRLNPHKLENVESEIQYMVDHDMVTQSHSEWSSPVVLVAKSGGTSFRLCIDFRKVNSITKTDSYPIPRVDDCIDKIGQAQYVSKFDLLKGYWQVPLTPRAQEISAFVTPNGLYECKVMPFGMKNAPATFQRLMNHVTQTVSNCVVYIDDVIVYSSTFDDHVQSIRDLFDSLVNAKLTVNLSKCEIGKANVIYLGHVVGSGILRPVSAKVQSILDLSTPTCKRDVMRVLGTVGYYRRYCQNFSDIVAPLTDLLAKSVPFVWSDHCQAALNHIKALLSSSPVLVAPDFDKGFSLFVDASDIGVGAVLMQIGVDGVYHPVGYFSKKLLKYQQKYSTIEKEALSLLMALKHFEVYVSPGLVEVFTDHNPLVFLEKMKNKNRRLTGWFLCLQEFSLCIKHIPGKENVISDCLSRIKQE